MSKPMSGSALHISPVYTKEESAFIPDPTNPNGAYIPNPYWAAAREAAIASAVGRTAHVATSSLPSYLSSSTGGGSLPSYLKAATPNRGSASLPSYLTATAPSPAVAHTQKQSEAKSAHASVGPAKKPIVSATPPTVSATPATYSSPYINGKPIGNASPYTIDASRQQVGADGGVIWKGQTYCVGKDCVGEWVNIKEVASLDISDPQKDVYIRAEKKYINGASKYWKFYLKV